MTRLITLTLLYTLTLPLSASPYTMSHLNFGDLQHVRTFKDYAQLYSEAQSKLDLIFQLNLTESEKINVLSSLFLGVPYAANTLLGSIDTEEKLIVNFGAVDCFTYLDYVEALRKSTNMRDFYSNLIETRYVNGSIDYLSRRHFFSDWIAEAKPNAIDITPLVSEETISINKQLNLGPDNKPFIPKLQPKDRVIHYIPSARITDKIFTHLQTGDYIGIYTDTKGLDVTHTGLYVLTEQGPMFRNASSKSDNMKVVDSPFLEYMGFEHQWNRKQR